MKLEFSIIVPVYNRPQEIEELLRSLSEQTFQESFEIIVVDDGSEQTCSHVVEAFAQLNVRYFFQANSGPGASRNFGMSQATGNYFVVLDSDVVLPSAYLQTVCDRLHDRFTDAFGGPDAAHPNFTALQHAINYSMTALLTTGGIRGKKNGVGKFQPRSFNMGISKVAFEKTKGYSDMRAGEDIDLTFRLWQAGFETQLIEEAFVFHKRRNTLGSFYKQTFAFGSARPQLNRKYPGTAKLTYWFPSLFVIGLDIAIILIFFGVFLPALVYAAYFVLIFLDVLVKNLTRPKVAFLTLMTTYIQFMGYGLGFLQSQLFARKKVQ